MMKVNFDSSYDGIIINSFKIYFVGSDVYIHKAAFIRTCLIWVTFVDSFPTITANGSPLNCCHFKNAYRTYP